ncbi:MAG: hypothetical protein AAF378_18620 [Cyanobacteria bacterium P01_A01_bin.84]
MFNIQRHLFKILLGLSIIPIGISVAQGNTCEGSKCYFSTYNPEFNYQQVAQNRSNFLSFIWGRRTKKPLGSRSLVCPVAPGLIETLKIWNTRPSFLWQGKVKDKETQLIVRERHSESNLWEKTVNLADKQVFYQGKTSLKPGKLYQWKLAGVTDWINFEIMSESDRQKIKTDLQKLEQKLPKSPNSREARAMYKADYFIKYSTNPQNSEVGWSDALQALYEVENPSTSFMKKRQQFVANICTHKPVDSAKQG